MSNNQELHGVVVPIITPVDAEDRVDERSFRQVIRYLIDGGVHGLFVGGSAGEGPLLTNAEWERMMVIALDETAGALPLLGGVMETSTQRAIAKIKTLRDIGYRQYAISPTFYLTLHADTEHLRLFGACKEAVPELEMVVYNIPSCTHSTIAVETFLEMARRGWLRYCKESSGDPELLLPLIEHGRELGMRVLVGEERLMYEGLIAGGVGMVPVGANYEPWSYVQLYEAALRLDEEEMTRLMQRVRYVCTTLTGGTSWLAGIKYALAQRGIGTGKPVSPLEPTDDERAALIDAITPVDESRQPATISAAGVSCGTRCLQCRTPDRGAESGGRGLCRPRGLCGGPVPAGPYARDRFCDIIIVSG